MAKIYEKKIEIIESEELIIDRSLSSMKFYSYFNYSPPEWDIQISQMKINSERNTIIN